MGRSVGTSVFLGFGVFLIVYLIVGSEKGMIAFVAGFIATLLCTFGLVRREMLKLNTKDDGEIN